MTAPTTSRFSGPRLATSVCERRDDGCLGHSRRYPRPGRLRRRRHHGLWRVATEHRVVVRSQRGERRDASQRRGTWGRVGEYCPMRPPDWRFNGAGPMQLNVWRPSNGVWVHRRVVVGHGRRCIRVWCLQRHHLRTGYGRRRRGRRVVFRPSTGTWYGLRTSGSLTFAVTWGQPGDIRGPPFGPDRSNLGAHRYPQRPA